nr:ABC-2 family transporter protein [Kineococcus siccus]
MTFVWVIIQYYLWRSVYAARPVVGGFDFETMRTYVVLAYGLNALVGWRIASEMMSSIRTGAVTLDVLRPIDYRTAQLARAAGWGVVEGALSLLVSIVVGLLLLRISPPAGPVELVLFAVSVVLAFVTKALLVFLGSLLMFWTTNGLGVMWSLQALIQVLSGGVVPLSLLPSAVGAVVEVLPFRGVVWTPVGIYLGLGGLGRGVALLGLQALWVCVLWFAAGRAWRRAFAAVEVQGG